MIDLSNLKAPGWGRVVAELSAAAPDDRAFLERLLATLAQVTAARQGVLFLAGRAAGGAGGGEGEDGGEGAEIEVRAVSVWPPAGPGAGASGGASGGAGGEGVAERVEFASDASGAARAAVSSGQARAFGLEKRDSAYYDGQQSQGYILSVPLTGAGGPASQAPGAALGAVTLLIEQRSKDAIRSNLAMIEVLAGYLHAHAGRQSLKRTQQASFALDLATRLVASVNTASGFKGASLQLVNDLARQFAVDRVALGWVRGAGGEGADSVRVLAISDTEHFDKRMAMVQKLQAAMDECLDQEQPILFPQPSASGEGADVLLSQAIVHAHRELAASDAKLKVCSVPLRVDDAVLGVVTIESTSAGAIDLATIELIQSALDLVAPVMRIRRSDDRNLALRAWASTLRGAGWAVGAKHTAWKLAGLALFAAAMFVTFYQTTYRVGADAVLQPREKRTVSAPLDGQIKRLGLSADGREIEPGATVREGDLLFELDPTEFQLAAADARGKIEQARLQASAAVKEKDTGKAQQAEVQGRRAEAELAIYEDRLARTRVRAPISGTIIAGELKNRVRSSIKLGESVMEIAPLDDLVVVARVDERDVSLVSLAAAGGRGTGTLATKSRPTDKFAFTVERIVPLAEAKEGKNTFEVRGTLDGPAPDWMQPGMEGLAKFDTERHSLAWIGSRRILNAVRFWLWW